MKLHQYLLDNSDLIKYYFPSEEHELWLDDYRKRNIPHDEPWLTLISVYIIFGSSQEKNETKVFNQLMNDCGIKNYKPISSIDNVKVEMKLPEILSYREFLYGLARDETFHYYPDRIETITDRSSKGKGSLEGNTNLDLLVEATRNNEEVVFFIESKFLSDIDSKISYNPVRDQIARNIDCGIDYCEKNDISISNFHFLMLTPKTFKTSKYGGNRKDQLNILKTDRARFFCYKMDDYKDPNKLSEALPHRKDVDMEVVSKNIGWITFEDIYSIGITCMAIKESEAEMTTEFFKERNLIEVLE